MKKKQGKDILKKLRDKGLLTNEDALKKQQDKIDAEYEDAKDNLNTSGSQLETENMKLKNNINFKFI